MKRLVLVVAGALALAGCAKPVWNKPYASAQDYTAAHDACMQDAKQHGYIGESLWGDSVFSEINWPSRYRECMDEKGWYEETQIWGFESGMHD